MWFSVKQAKMTAKRDYSKKKKSLAKMKIYIYMCFFFYLTEHRGIV